MKGQHIITFEVGLKLVSEANGSHGHWSKRSAHVREQRETFVTACARMFGLPRITFQLPKPPRKYAVARWVTPYQLPLVITITRIAPSRLDDDNLARSAKAIRDQLAELQGVDDRNPGVTWLYDQRRGAVRQYAVEVAMHARI
jgi:hypothetical protein